MVHRRIYPKSDKMLITITKLCNTTMDSATSLERSSKKFCTTRRLCFLLCSLIVALLGIQLLGRRLMTDNAFPEDFLAFPFGSRNCGDLNTTTRLDSFADNVTNDFHPVNVPEMFSFSNVCIEGLDSATQPITNYDSTSWRYWNDTQRIVVYNDCFDGRGVKKILTMRTPRTYTPWTSWDVHFSPSRVPRSHTMLETTAYFVDPMWPENIHHFWYDLFAPLYAVMKATKRLHAGADNRIVYRSPWATHKLIRFDVLLNTLPINTSHEIFSRVQPNTCFRSAVFGTTVLGNFDPCEVVNHVMRTLNVKRSESDGGYVTFIQRTRYRFIANVDELMTAARSLNYTKVRVVSFESLDLVAQATVAADSRVMVGVQGAGLQWAIFMPPGSTLVEIAWPEKHWPFYYSQYVSPYDIVCDELTAASVQPNWTAYEAINHKDKRVPEEEQQRLLKAEPRRWDTNDNVWKSADSVLSKDDLLRILRRIKKNEVVADRGQ